MLMKPLRKEKIQQIMRSGVININIDNNSNDNNNKNNNSNNNSSIRQTVIVDRIAPAFRLCDSTFDSFEFPLNVPGTTTTTTTVTTTTTTIISTITTIT